jgi:acetyl-CoA carboxylase biotin carboxyl carrier protein
MNGTKKKGGKDNPRALAAVAAPGKAGGRAKVESALDLETVRELARIIEEFGLTEVEADPSGHVRVRRELSVVGGAVAGASAASPALALAPPPPPEGPAEAGTFITSPFVGTFYRAPSPDAPAFVELGQAVRKGQVVCIVEAMKLMNEIEAETDGKVAEILAQNGEHVEYGQKLIRLAK